MRSAYLLLAVFLISCGGRTLNDNFARHLITRVPQEVLKKEDVDVESVSQLSGSEAIIETKLKTAFRVEKVQGQWVIREVRIGHGQWENVSNLAQTLEAVKIGETRKLLNQIAAALQEYRKDNGALPVFKDYIALSDLLAPKYMNPLIRLDAWRQPFAAERRGSDSIVLSSAGADGVFGTNDDIILIFPQ